MPPRKAPSFTVDEAWAFLRSHPKVRQTYPTPEELATAEAVYTLMLGDIVPDDLLRAVVLEALDKCVFFPTVAELRAIYRRLTARPAKTGVEAWNDLLQSIRSGRPVGDPLALRAAGGLAGVREIGQCDVKYIDRLRSDFVRTYEAIDAREREAEQIAPQVGRALAAVPHRALGPSPDPPRPAALARPGQPDGARVERAPNDDSSPSPKRGIAS
jgi:hypothetical protein